MIQIIYEDECSPLSQEIETQIEEKMAVVLKKLHKDQQLVSVYFCSSESIRVLNQTHRQQDKETDILSWSYEDEEGAEEGFSEAEIWGELVLCLEVCQRQADLANWNLEVELLRLLVHGLAHLVGYDHEASLEDEKRMLKFEMGLLSSINLESIYH